MHASLTRSKLACCSIGRVGYAPMMYTCLRVAVALVQAHAAAAALTTDVLVGRGDTLAPFSMDSGGKLALSTAPATVPWSGLPFLNLSYDFTNGGWGANLSPVDQKAAVASVPKQQALRFSAYLPAEFKSQWAGDAQVALSVTDSKGNKFGNGVAINPKGAPKAPYWMNFTVNLTQSSFWKTSEVFTLPITALSLGVSSNNKENKVGWVGLADIAMVSTAAPGDFGSPIFHDLVQPAPETAGVLVAGSSAELAAKIGSVVSNRLEADCDVTVEVQMKNTSGPMGEGEWVTCATAPETLRPWESVTLLCTVDPATQPAGWYPVRSYFSASSCWSQNDTQQVLEGAVVLSLKQPDVTPVLRNVNPGVFGGQMLPSDAAGFRIGMRTLRTGPLWHWNQPDDCWNLSSCFNWGFGYDDVFVSSATGLEIMIDARELAPPWAAAKNDSGGAWSGIPAISHYPDYQRWMTVMLQRYGSMATAVEVGNEQDGYAYFANDKLPFDYAVNLSLAMINLTRDAIHDCGDNCSHIQLMGLSSSMFDVGQTGNGGSKYLHYEDLVTSGAGVMDTLKGFTFHTYAQGTWVPFNKAPWGNTTFYYPNEGTGSWATNSTVVEVLVMVDLLKKKAAAAGIQDFAPTLWLSEMGYNLQLRNSVGSGWTRMHGALVAHLMIHMRSAPIAQYVKKAFYFAADDGCCVESDGYFGLWRPAMMRAGVNATSDEEDPTHTLTERIPLAGAASYATASVLVDVPSGRLAGVFVVDNSNQTAGVSGQTPGKLAVYKPSCVAFEPDPTSSLKPAPQPLVVLMTTAHHYNDFTPATISVATKTPEQLSLRNGLGAPMALPTAVADGGADVALTLRITALPQYLTVPNDTTAAAVCATLKW
jgi:hypothetical protein